MKLIRILVLGFCGISVGLAQCHGETKRLEVVIKEVPLGELKPQLFHYPLNEVLGQSAECRHVAFSVPAGSNMVVYIDGIPSHTYDDAGMVAFGPGAALQQVRKSMIGPGSREFACAHCRGAVR